MNILSRRNHRTYLIAQQRFGTLWWSEDVHKVKTVFARENRNIDLFSRLTDALSFGEETWKILQNTTD